MPSAQLLLSVLYLIPALAIIWHTLSERLPTYHAKGIQQHLCVAVDFEVENKAAICCDTDTSSSSLGLVFDSRKFLTSRTLLGFIVAHLVWTVKTPFAMSTRYWDEIDWYIQEGTQKLSEMLNQENEDASSSKWSTGEEEDDIPKENATEEKLKNKENEIIDKFDNISIKEEVSDGDSVKDDEEYMERSTSVEDENTAIIKKQTKVDELILMCTQCSMLPPIYTYFTTGDEQVVATVQLWNGVRFSSHPQITRDKAMEEAAGQAIGYLKNEQRDKRPVSTSPPSSVPYYLPMQNLVPPQYYQAHAAAYGSPVPYAATPQAAYFLPSVPYTMVQQPPVVTIPPEYQHAAFLQQQYRFEQAAQYSPYHQHYPAVRMQVSPTHQVRNMYHHHPAAGAKPVVWTTNLHHDMYQAQDQANMQRKPTQYKLLDKPPTAVTLHQMREAELQQNTSDKSLSEIAASETEKVGKTKELSSRKGGPKKQNTPKPKLAISFNKEQAQN